MAKPSLRLSGNAPGDLYVDASCIDCDTCRWMAPDTFVRDGKHSVVATQPQSEEQWMDALRALVSCPTASIGCEGDRDIQAAARTLPIHVEPDVLHIGFHAESSFGAASYLVLREEGNVMVDSPRFSEALARRIEERGGASLMFLTHRDDVADHVAWAARLGCERILHLDDMSAGTASVETAYEGQDLDQIADDLVIIPTPGHTEGSMCLLFDDRVLFTGDHLAWSDAMQELYAFRGACWFDWDVQIESMRRLLGFEFEVVLPGHGRRCRFSRVEMHERLQRCIAWMEEMR
jgi:glyoxylase-like metal-dependent hydrolase (beta-lactamase superfamily II)/ferredoxin